MPIRLQPGKGKANVLKEIKSPNSLASRVEGHILSHLPYNLIPNNGSSGSRVGEFCLRK